MPSLFTQIAIGARRPATWRNSLSQQFILNHSYCDSTWRPTWRCHAYIYIHTYIISLNILTLWCSSKNDLLRILLGISVGQVQTMSEQTFQEHVKCRDIPNFCSNIYLKLPSRMFENYQSRKIHGYSLILRYQTKPRNMSKNTWVFEMAAFKFQINEDLRGQLWVPWPPNDHTLDTQSSPIWP